MLKSGFEMIALAEVLRMTEAKGWGLRMVRNQARDNDNLLQAKGRGNGEDTGGDRLETVA